MRLRERLILRVRGDRTVKLSFREFGDRDWKLTGYAIRARLEGDRCLNCDARYKNQIRMTHLMSEPPLSHGLGLDLVD